MASQVTSVAVCVLLLLQSEVNASRREVNARDVSLHANGCWGAMSPMDHRAQDCIEGLTELPCRHTWESRGVQEVRLHIDLGERHTVARQEELGLMPSKQCISLPIFVCVMVEPRRVLTQTW